MSSNKNIIRLVVGPVATNCWIYPYGEESDAFEAVIIDPGDDAKKIISALEKASLTPKYILLTHGHFDHICALPKLAEKYPDAKIGIHSQDAEYLGPESYQVHERSIKAAMGTAALMNIPWEELPSADIRFEEGSVTGPFTVLHLPGHTPGSCAFLDKNEGILFTGDTLFKRGYGRTDLPGGNEKQIFESLKRLLKMDRNIKVYPGHGETTLIAQEYN